VLIIVVDQGCSDYQWLTPTDVNEMHQKVSMFFTDTSLDMLDFRNGEKAPTGKRPRRKLILKSMREEVNEIVVI
jgi:hypothetical protein